MFKNVLVPLDGSEAAERAGAWAVQLAGSLGARATLLAVSEPQPDEAWLQAGPTPAARSSAAPVAAVAAQPEPSAGGPAGYLAGMAARHDPEGRFIQRAVATGSPADEILRVARDSRADLVVLAACSGGSPAYGTIGSVADRVLHASAVPVLIVRPGQLQRSRGAMPRTVVVPLDGSELAECSVTAAMSTAAALGAGLLFLRVVPGLPAAVAAGPHPGDYRAPAMRREALEYLNGFVSQSRERGISAGARAPAGNPAGLIIGDAEHAAPSLVVIGAQGASGLKRWVIGGVADKVMRGSSQPVLVLPPSMPGL